MRKVSDTLLALSTISYYTKSTAYLPCTCTRQHISRDRLKILDETARYLDVSVSGPHMPLSLRSIGVPKK
jgi:hypothetical protein